MISPLTQRALTRVADNGFVRAKKLADLAVKTNTDGNGKPTSAGYEQAISYLQPYLGSGNENNAIDAQRLIAGYNNSYTKLSKTQRDQNETVAAFKLQEMDSYFTSADGDVGNFRNPGNLIEATSQSLDQLTLGVINAIDEKQANGDSTDALEGYLRDLNKRSSSLRDLSNKFASGQLGKGQTLDGFGYYVDTNPIDGSVRSAALIPTSLAPDGLTNGYRRLTATAKVGDALVPVYAPAQKDGSGEYVAKVGDATWSGSGDAPLEGASAGKSSFLFQDGGFNISDKNQFPVPKTQIDKGQFGIGFAGKDEKGNAVEAVVYRGADGQLYKIDKAMIDQFGKDPVMSAKLNGYMPRFSPTEMQGLLRDAQPLSSDLAGKQGSFIGHIDDAAKTQAESDSLNQKTSTFFGAAKVGLEQSGDLKKYTGPGGEYNQPGYSPMNEQQQQDYQAYLKTGKQVNRTTTPTQPAVGDNASSIIDQGKKVFNSIGGFFKSKFQSQ